MTTNPTTMSLKFPAKPEYLVLGRLALSALARHEPISAQNLSDLKLALTEGCSNVVRHAYGGREGSVDVRYELGDEYIAITITDDGVGFDAGRNTMHDLELLGDGGLGLAIISAVSDHLEIRPREDGTGSCIKFVKVLEPQETPSS
jgi:serine/threonine-protein kinase RsbW